MCIDFRKNQRCPKPVYIKGEAMERVETYKYLGVVFGSKLNWKENINSVLKTLVSQLVGALSPVNHRELHQGCILQYGLQITDKLVSWRFEPSQALRIISGINKSNAKQFKTLKEYITRVTGILIVLYVIIKNKYTSYAFQFKNNNNKKHQPCTPDLSVIK